MRGILIGLFFILFVFPAASQSKRDAGDKPNTISRETLDLLKVDYLHRGIAAYNKGQFGQAIVDFTKAITQLSTNPDAEAASEIYTKRAAAYYRKGRFHKAIADATKAIAFAPTYSRAYNMRAWILHQKGENAKALPDANKALELAPVDANNLETRAEIYEKLGQRENAISDYRAALKQDPSDKDSLAGLKRLGGAP